MAIIAKIDPPLQPDPLGRVQLHARPYENVAPKSGDLAFVWTSEKSGGTGLVARGKIERVSKQAFPNKTGAGYHDETVLVVVLDGLTPSTPLTITQIGPYRDRGGPTPLAYLSRMLYKHAHNKIALLDQSTTEFMNSKFNPT